MDRPATLTVLRDLEEFLRSHGVNYADVIAELRSRLTTDEFRGSRRAASEVRALFGGMGSLTDVWISKVNRDTVEDEQAANQRLDKLRDQLWEQVEDSES